MSMNIQILSFFCFVLPHHISSLVKLSENLRSTVFKDPCQPPHLLSFAQYCSNWIFNHHFKLFIHMKVSTMHQTILVVKSVWWKNVQCLTLKSGELTLLCISVYPLLWVKMGEIDCIQWERRRVAVCSSYFRRKISKMLQLYPWFKSDHEFRLY